MAPQRNAGAGAEAELPEYAGHYRLESRLGSGGMGVVHLARSTSGLKLAVKVVHAEFARDPEFRGRFRQEVAAARRVSGAFTAPVVDADPEAERPWMATLFIPGPTLAEQVKQHGPMPASQLRRLMAGLAEALRDIHRVGVVHRDLKPSNVLLAEDGPKVIDFGISRPSDSELRTETGKLIGTPPFMAPEQFRSPREVGPAADIFALGSVLVHAATGRGPFDSDSPYIVAYQVVHDEPDLTGVPDDLAPLVLRCLAKEPQDRPAPDELMRELRSVAASYDTQTFIPPQRTGTAAPVKQSEEPAEEPSHGPAEGPAPAELAEKPGEKPAAQPAAPEADRRPARRPGRKAALGAGALALALAGGLASLQLFAGENETPEKTASRTSAAAFTPWDAAPTGEQGFAQCSHGAGRLLCTHAGTVLALDPDDGDVLWRRPVRNEPSGPPALSGGLVHPLLTLRRGLVALDPASGKPKWRQEAAVHDTGVFAGDTLLLTGADGTVTALDSASGEKRWSRSLPGHTAPVLLHSFPGDPLAYAVSTSLGSRHTRVTALGPLNGEVRWEARMAGSLSPVGTADGAMVFLAVDTVDGKAQAVVRYEPGTRRTRRAALPVPLEQPQGMVRSGTAYLSGAGGRIVAFDTGALRQRWSLETGAVRTSVPAADERYVYVTAPDGRLLAVDARAGRLAGQTAARLGKHGDRVPASLPAPVVGGGRVYAAAPDGTVFAVDGRNPAGW
ncbi:hypothetical protein GCM10009601_40330 [Streptomyces thermospinosisporus]|uniref:Protein kinase domain-containing protein n=1 Tax=Streptomyces thermospinosisporus TaxID=161482 RepID=A0ABN1Z1Y6_9ACTN